MSKLFVCPTPLGNLEDITLRTCRVLKEVDIVAAEDTRHTLRLLNHLHLKKSLISLHEHNEYNKSQELLHLIKEGKSVALVSDAGMPGISDPGEILIRKAIDQEIPVEVLPGGTAFATALIGSGLPAGKFIFWGFLDRRNKERKKELTKLKYIAQTMLFYESPHRISKTLQDMYEVLGNRRIVVARELTKKFEEYIRTTLSELIEKKVEFRLQGELVLVVEGSQELPPEEQEKKPLEDALEELMNGGVSLKEAAKQLSMSYHQNKNEIYQLGIRMKEKE